MKLNDNFKHGHECTDIPCLKCQRIRDLYIRILNNLYLFLEQELAQDYIEICDHEHLILNLCDRIIPLTAENIKNDPNINLLKDIITKQLKEYIG